MTRFPAFSDEFAKTIVMSWHLGRRCKNRGYTTDQCNVMEAGARSSRSSMRRAEAVLLDRIGSPMLPRNLAKRATDRAQGWLERAAATPAGVRERIRIDPVGRLLQPAKAEFHRPITSDIRGHAPRTDVARTSPSRTSRHEAQTPLRQSRDGRIRVRSGTGDNVPRRPMRPRCGRPRSEVARRVRVPRICQACSHEWWMRIACELVLDLRSRHDVGGRFDLFANRAHAPEGSQSPRPGSI
jgi:hypothetical protein